MLRKLGRWIASQIITEEPQDDVPPDIHERLDWLKSQRQLAGEQAMFETWLRYQHDMFWVLESRAG